MKILLIYRENETKSINWFVTFLGKLNISAEILPVRFPEDPEDIIIRQFVSLFGLPVSNEETDTTPILQRTFDPSHVLILSSFSHRWYDFFAGFSYGTDFPIVVYGKQAGFNVPGEFNDRFILLETEEAILKYFEAEIVLYHERELIVEKLRAREALLEMGVPVSNESMANCAGEDSLQGISYFLKAGFSPDTLNRNGVPVLNISARKGNLEILEFLIHSGAHVNLISSDRGSSALIDAVMGKHKEMVADLIKAGADVNIKSKDGQTALIIAVGTGDEGIVRLLLEAGADPEITDNMGVSARKYAVLFHKPGIVELFGATAQAV